MNIAEITRIRSLEYGTEQLRRARCAITDSLHDDLSELRRQSLQSIVDRMATLLHELKALS